MSIPLNKKGNTRVIPYFDGFIIKLYETSIIIFNSEIIVLNSGGYKTSTTKNRMNHAAREFNLNFNVYQKKGQWFVNDQEFFDGMELKR